jgi:hypothetical protein
MKNIKKSFLFGLLFIAFTSIFSQDNNSDFPKLAGPYLGQKSPGEIPELFAKTIMNAEMGYHSSIVFSPDLKEALWRPMDNNGGKILYSKMKNKKWTKPEWINFGIEEGILDPIFSVDGNRVYFLSFKPDVDGKNQRERIWYVDKTPDGWSKPKLIDKVVYDHPTHWTFSLAKNGNLYFTSEAASVREEQDIYLSRFVNNKYLPPEDIGSAINSNEREFTPFIAPDESYLIFARYGISTKNPDLFISFKDSKGNWSRAINMGEKINSDTNDLAPYVSPDGKYFFFVSQREKLNAIMWVNSEIIYEIKKEQDKTTHCR